MEDIETLIEKAKNNDSESMEIILQFFKPKVSAICREYFLIGSDFDDILQEGMIGLYKAIQNYDKDKNDNFSSFATLCIHRQIQNAVKIANSKKNIPLNDYMSINTEGGVESENEFSTQIYLETKDKGAERISLEKEKNSNIINQIKTLLNNEQLKVFYLYIKGYKYSEIAIMLGKKPKKIDNIIQTVKRKLRKIRFDN